MQFLKRLQHRTSSFPLSVRTIPNATDVPSAAAYIESLDACINSKSLKPGHEIHQHLLKNTTFITDTIVLDKLTRLYIECGKVRHARKLFDEIPDPSVILWNMMIRAYAWNGPFNEAIDLYRKMVVSGVIPTKFTFPFVLKACSGLCAGKEGEKIHALVIRLGLQMDGFVSTALVDLYAKCGDLDGAWEVFVWMRCRDVVAWNAMIAGFSLHGFYDDMIQLVMEMQESGTKPNSSTMVSVLPSVARAGTLDHGKEIHGYCVRQSFSTNVVVGTALLDMYGKCCCLSYARRIHDCMGVANEVTWSALIGAYVIAEQMSEALELYDHVVLTCMEKPSVVILGGALQACAKLIDTTRGRRIHSQTLKLGYSSDLIVANTLLSMYAKCGSLDDATRFFNKMNPKDTVSYGAMISGCVQNGNSTQALDIFRNMNSSRISPDVAVMLGVINACSHLAALHNGACAHGYAIVCGFMNEISICNSLIDMYVKCGRVSVAREIFDRMSDRDIVSWNTLIAGYGVHGLGSDALSLFHELKATGLKVDDVTVISVLTACSHSGLVTEGKHWFHQMVQEYSILPRIDHYICMVDLLGRAGLLVEARNLIEKMPLKHDVHIWSALLAACRVHKNIELGEEASQKIQSLGPEGTGNFVLLSNLYSTAGRWQDAACVRIRQMDAGFRKSPGCSWLEINGVIHAFIGGDRSHARSADIHKKLEEWQVEMKKLGYHAAPGFVVQDVEEEEKEHILLYHSEKLAIAFADISLRPGQQITITKNLRVCGDCHDAIKYISLITGREITVRDAIRFHHFRDGLCNCRDFW